MQRFFRTITIQNPAVFPDGSPVFSNMEVAGFIPMFLNIHDPRPTAEQLDANYSHGGGWRPMSKFRLRQVGKGLSPEAVADRSPAARLTALYPGDPPFREMSRAVFRDDLLVLFTSSLLAIIRPDGTFEIARVD